MLKIERFKNKQELWQWLIDGGEIIEPFDAGSRKIKLCNGNPIYENGEEAKNCLFSHDYWLKHNAKLRRPPETD